MSFSMKKLAAAAAVALVLPAVAGAQQRTINVDLFDTSAAGSPVSGNLSAFPAPQNGGTTFNGVSGNDFTSVALVDSTGAATGVTISGSNPDFGNPEQGDFTASGVGGFQDTLVTLGAGFGQPPEANTGTVTLAGLNPSSTFDLFLFGFFNADTPTRENALFTVNSLPSQGTTGALSATTGFTPGEDFVVFEDVAPVDGGITITFTSNNPSRPVGVFNGLQIVETPVPEPATLGVLSLAGLGLLARRRGA